MVLKLKMWAVVLILMLIHMIPDGKCVDVEI